MDPRSRVGILASALALTALFATYAQAHNWGCWRQPNRTVYSYITAALSSQANAAVSEWDSKTVLALPRVGYHTEISVFDGYYGNTGWAGIASIESYSGCNILHGHARVNRSYSYTSNGYRGIFCQEVGHLFGLDHSNDGGCMGGGYYYSINTYYTVVQHNINDIASKYSGVPLAMTPDGETASFVPGREEDHFLDGEIPEGTARAVAFWHERPHTLEEAMERSQAVVTARVLRVVPGPDLVVPVEGLENNVDRIPTQRILLAVEDVMGGRLNSRVVELFHTGNESYVVEEDPPYAVGERYVLFLTEFERGTWRVVSPEGRLLVGDSGLVPSSKREFMSELRGTSVQSLTGELAQLAPRTEGMPEAGTGLQLRRNAGNPFTTSTSLSYALSRPSKVKLAVYDAQGREVRTLVDAYQDGPRWYTVSWDGSDGHGRSVANGVYFVRLVTAEGARSVTVVRMQ